MSRVYLSGPISGITRDEAVRRFRGAQSKWESLGYSVVNPLRNGLPYDADWRRQMAVDLCNLSSCDTVYMLDGWQSSDGACLELMCALTRNIRVYFETMIDVEFMAYLVRAANEMRVALRLDEKLMFDAEWYAAQCVANGYFEQPK